MHPSVLPSGAVVGYRLVVHGVSVFHVGIVTDRSDQRGLPHVISASKRTGLVREETWSEFTQGAAVVRQNIGGRLPSHEVLRRARSQIGEEWSLLWANCEHFVRWAHGLPRESPQLKAAVATTTVFAFGALVVGLGVAALAGAGAAAART